MQRETSDAHRFDWSNGRRKTRRSVRNWPSATMAKRLPRSSGTQGRQRPPPNDRRGRAEDSARSDGSIVAGIRAGRHAGLPGGRSRRRPLHQPRGRPEPRLRHARPRRRSPRHRITSRIRRFARIQGAPMAPSHWSARYSRGRQGQTSGANTQQCRGGCHIGLAAARRWPYRTASPQHTAERDRVDISRRRRRSQQPRRRGSSRRRRHRSRRL